MSIDRWIDKEDVAYEYYSARKNEILPFTASWIDLDNIMLSEVSQTEKNKYYMISLTCGI